MVKKYVDIEDLLISKITVDYNGCWIIKSSRDDGYTETKLNGKKILSHRLAYQLWVGPIPKGLDLDHKCRNRACCCPSHLEPVTRRENVKRGLCGDLCTHCPRGHEYTSENTGYYKRPNRRGCTSGRYCKTCERVRSKDRKNKIATGKPPRAKTTTNEQEDEVLRQREEGSCYTDLARELGWSVYKVKDAIKRAKNRKEKPSSIQETEEG